MSRKDAQYLAEQVEFEGLRITRAEDSFVWDDARRKYIDFVMGWCVGNLGWGLPEIEDAIARARHPNYVYPHYSYRGWAVLAELLVDIVPDGLRRCYRATGGSEAVEIALQIARTATGRTRFVALEDSYHGNTIAIVELPRQIKPPLDEAKLDRVETLLKKRDVAAFIMEPISINLGVLVPDAAFMTGLRKLCDRYGTLLIFDEVASGFGRTGNMFATEHFDIEPDIITLGKALSGGYGGLGATIVTERVHSKVRGEFEAYSTYGWHPSAVVGASAYLRYWKKWSHDLLFNCVTMGAFLERRLGEIFDPSAVHAKGLAICVDVDSESYAEKVVRRCRAHRLLITSSGSYLQFLPALTLERSVAERAMNILEGIV